MHEDDQGRKKPKRPRIHWLIIVLNGVLALAFIPDHLTGLVAIGRTTHWIENRMDFNAFTFAVMAWHVVLWGPATIYLTWKIWKRKHMARRLGFLVFGGEGAVAVLRLAFNQFLLFQNEWPHGAATSALESSALWLIVLAANAFLASYFWKFGHTFNR